MMHSHCKAILFTATALGATMSAPALAQSAEAGNANDIIVTAQRIEQRLQDVPISITVLDNATIANNNIQAPKDIAIYTPGLSVNSRYGSDNTTWAIRGFTVEQRTTATVGTYFADVVAPRGSGATQGGDGAGPGALFDLQNIQVLKGPQGTLFGRNSTGGAVLLVPRKPVENLEGYVEGSVGDYGMWRGQGVLNIPVMDTLRVRLGVDRSKRDGYLKNAGNIGFGPYGDAGGSVDVWALRFSAVADLTPDLENYMVATYSKSKSTGIIPKVVECYGAAPDFEVVTTGTACTAQMDREAELGFWSVSNTQPIAGSVTEQWQVINTTTWRASDNLTIKNIFSYAEFRGAQSLDLFGNYTPLVASGTETSGNEVLGFANLAPFETGYTNAQSSLVEELQFQGNAFDSRLIWQAGLYLEVNDPLGASGTMSNTFTPCADVRVFDCRPAGAGGSIGRLGFSSTRTSFNGKAAYAQASYDLTEQLKLTGGIRYTIDKMVSDFQVVNISHTLAGDSVSCANTPTFGAPGSANNPILPLDQRFTACLQHHRVKTKAPTWLIGLDYKPMDDVLLYAKWSRGYRQGGIAAFGADLLQDYDKETVDTYEIGTKTSWRGAAPGFLNISAFYNDFRDQQLQIGLSCTNPAVCGFTTAILNAGKSRLYGFEVDAGLTPFRGLDLKASYAYLNTKVTEIIDITPIVEEAGLPYDDIRPIPVGSKIPLAVPHKVTGSATYTLPLDASIGEVSFGGTIVYQSSYRAVSDGIAGSNNGVIPSYMLLNLNANWANVGGLPVDLGVFVTNVTKEKYFLHVNDQQTRGFLSRLIGEPRMWGVRLRYSFGQ